VLGKIRQKICVRGKNWAQSILVEGKKCVFVVKSDKNVCDLEILWGVKLRENVGGLAVS